MTPKRKWLRRGTRTLILVFVLMNIIAAFHSYKFTHFTESDVTKTNNPDKLSIGQKVQTLIFGVSNPRPVNNGNPSTDFTTVHLKSNRDIECWSIKTDSAKGTMVLFHGFGGEKSSLLDKAAVFRSLGYNTLLVDFMGSGGSEGNQTTIGYKEAEQVKTCFEYLVKQGEKKIYLFGTSMGAVAIIKAIHDYQITPEAIIIECPFGSMYQTVCARFRSMNVPAFPMAGLLVFWGGVENGFWAFGHNPTKYAKDITCPTLLLYGAKDEKVSKEETDAIFANLKGKKEVKIYQEAGHENYLLKYKNEWAQDVEKFLKENPAN